MEGGPGALRRTHRLRQEGSRILRPLLFERPGDVRPRGQLTRYRGDVDGRGGRKRPRAPTFANLAGVLYR